MRQVLVVVVAGAIALGYYFRDRIVPYLPPAVAAYVVKAEGKGNKDSKAGASNSAVGGRPTNRTVAVQVAEARAGTLPIQRDTIGSIVPVKSTSLSTQTSGIVAQILVKDGATVQKGDLLIKLDDRLIQAQIAKDEAQIAKDQATLDNTRRTNERTKRLVETGVNAEQLGDDALAATKVAQGTLGVDQAAHAADLVSLSLTEIRAPFDGQLGAVLVSLGGYAAPGTPMVVITAMKPLYASFTLPETDLALARKAMAANMLTADVTPIIAATGTKPETGTITFIDNAVDPASATFTLRAQMPNEDGALWPGQSIDVTLNAGETEKLVIVPGVAVAPLENGSAVFVVKADGTVDRRLVTVALRQGDLAGLSSGLKEGEKVVVEGQASLYPGAKVTISDGSAKSQNGKPPSGSADAGKPKQATDGEVAASSTTKVSNP